MRVSTREVRTERVERHAHTYSPYPTMAKISDVQVPVRFEHEVHIYLRVPPCLRPEYLLHLEKPRMILLAQYIIPLHTITNTKCHSPRLH